MVLGIFNTCLLYFKYKIILNLVSKEGHRDIISFKKERKLFCINDALKKTLP